MAKFRIAPGASRDIVSVYETSESRFGPVQADAYLAGLEHTFALIADFPQIGRSCDELLPGLRRLRFRFSSSIQSKRR